MRSPLHRSRSWTTFALALTLWLAAAIAGAEPLAINESQGAYPASHALLYLEDPTRQLTIERVSAPDMAAQFKPAAAARNEVNFGYSHSAYWLALPLDVDADAPAKWLLEVGFSSLDRVELYRPLKYGGFAMQTAGDLQPFSQRPFAHRNLVFPVELRGREKQTLYLKVISDGTLTIPVTLWRPDALHGDDQATYAMLSLYYGMLIGLMLYNLLLFFALRDWVFLAYVGFVASMAIGQASLNGFGNQFLWPDWPRWGNIALPSGMAATGFFGALFTRLFLATRRDFPRLDRVIVTLAILFALAAVTPLFAPYQVAAVFTSITGLTFAVTAVAIGVYCDWKNHAGARYFLIAWSLLLVGVGVMALRNLGWIPSTNMTRYSMQIGSALEMLLLSFALADRFNTMRHEKEQATREALAAKHVMVETLQQTEQDLAARVAERTQALEDVNQILREKEQELAYQATHDALTGLANRALFHDRLAGMLARADRKAKRAALLMIDVDGFKHVNDAHGHDAGDLVLRAIAQRLVEGVREADTVARLGGDEFVVILEEINERADAAQVADKLVTSARQPIAHHAGSLTVTLSIGVACFPDDGSAHDLLLKKADDAMYRAKAAGRNRWEAAIPINRT